MSRRVDRIPDEGLGNTSYLVDLGAGLAAAVDPPRDVEPHLALADRRGLTVVAAMETHLHADFVSGARELAAATGADVYAPSSSGLEFRHSGVDEGHLVQIGQAELRVLATPGHTPEHVAYLLAIDDEPVGVFSGGSLIVGGAARTDLIAPDRTQALARAQFASLRRLAGLPDATELYPTHGAGSFCSAGAVVQGERTIGDERRSNTLLRIDDEDEFVRYLLGSYGSFPPYFLGLRSVNREPRLVGELPEPRPLDALEAAALIEDGACLVDARSIHDWADAHPPQAVSIQLRPAFASWLGWVCPVGAEIVLLVDDDRRDEAVRQARGIGYDRILGWVDGGVEAWRRAGLPLASIEEVDPHEARRRLDTGAVLVDVRQSSELAHGRIPTAVPLELGDIIAGRRPPGDEVVVYCGHGERSATAASLLAARGVRVANLVGGTEAWVSAGLSLESG